MTREEDIYYDAQANGSGGVKTPEPDRLLELPNSLQAALGDFVTVIPPVNYHFAREAAFTAIYAGFLRGPYHRLVRNLKVPVGYTTGGLPDHDLVKLSQRGEVTKNWEPWNVTVQLENHPTQIDEFNQSVADVRALMESEQTGINIDSIEFTASDVEALRLGVDRLDTLGIDVHAKVAVDSTHSWSVLDEIALIDNDRDRLFAKLHLNCPAHYNHSEAMRWIAHIIQYAVERDILFSIGGNSNFEDRLITGDDVGDLNLLLASAMALSGSESEERVTEDVVSILGAHDIKDFYISNHSIIWKNYVFNSSLLRRARLSTLQSVEHVGIHNLSSGLGHIKDSLKTSD